MNPEELKLIHVVADYGEKDPAFSEVFHRLKLEFPRASIQNTPVPRFSTVATGFWTAQLSLYQPEIENSIVYSNTAPRNVEDTTDNNGKEFVYARLENGGEVFTVNSGHCLSFVKDEIEELWKVDVPTNGSQFRSRDYFPRATAEVLEKGEEKLEEELNPDDIPDVPDSVVGYVDGYGNIKTTVRESEISFEEGGEVEVEISGDARKAFYKENTFEVPEGSLSLAPGSSGGDDAFLEVFLRGGSASKEYGGVDAGERVEIRTR